VNIDVDDENVSKAEIYLNGKTQNHINPSPHMYGNWMNLHFQTENRTKVYDRDGNPTQRGEIHSFVFNRPRSFDKKYEDILNKNRFLDYESRCIYV